MPWGRHVRSYPTRKTFAPRQSVPEATALRSAAASSPHTVREGRAAFLQARLEEVRERVHMRRRDVRVRREIRAGVEADRGVAALAPAESVVVVERIDAGGRDIAVGRKIPGGVEPCVRIAALVPAEAAEMRERVDAGRRDVRIVLQVI